MTNSTLSSDSRPAIGALPTARHMTAAWWPPLNLPVLLNLRMSQMRTWLPAAAYKTALLWPLRAMSFINVSPWGNCKLRVLVVLAWLPLAGHPEELRVLIHRLGDCLKSQTLTYAEDAVKTNPVSGEYLTATTLFGWRSNDWISTPEWRSQTLTVRSKKDNQIEPHNYLNSLPKKNEKSHFLYLKLPFEAEKRLASVAQMESTAWQCPSAVRVQIRGDLLLS